MQRERQSYVPVAPTSKRGGSVWDKKNYRPPLADNAPVGGVMLSIVRAFKAWKRGGRGRG